MKAGRLNTLAEIRRPAIAKDNRGQDITSWNRVARLWVDLRQLAGREREAALQVVAEADWRVFTRFVSGLTIATSDRLYIGDQAYEILAVIDLDNRHRTLQIELRKHS